jgi:hypothetical protein
MTGKLGRIHRNKKLNIPKRHLSGQAILPCHSSTQPAFE